MSQFALNELSLERLFYFWRQAELVWNLLIFWQYTIDGRMSAISRIFHFCLRLINIRARQICNTKRPLAAHMIRVFIFYEWIVWRWILQWIFLLQGVVTRSILKTQNVMFYQPWHISERLNFRSHLFKIGGQIHAWSLNFSSWVQISGNSNLESFHEFLQLVRSLLSRRNLLFK